MLVGGNFGNNSHKNLRVPYCFSVQVKFHCQSFKSHKINLIHIILGSYKCTVFEIGVWLFIIEQTINKYTYDFGKRNYLKIYRQ